MNRRDFLQLSMYAGCSCLLPELSWAAGPLDNVSFDPAIYAANQPQTIMVFMYGGASELAGNFTNYNQFKDLSQSSYDVHFRDQVNSTPNGFWQEAGGTIMEELLAQNRLNVFRTCFSQVRWNENNRSHGPCTSQNQRGSFNEEASGIFANLGRLLKQNNVIDSNTKMPFLTMEGESGFWANGDLARDPILVPMSINENLDNPFRRSGEPHYAARMDALAKAYNSPGKITDAFAKRGEMEQFISDIPDISGLDLGTNGAGDDLNYHNNSFDRKLKTAINILDYNPDTQAISLSTGGLGGWDDHNDARNYISRMNSLFLALRSAMAHINHIGKTNKINIVVMSEFGRGVNLNSANGWDHGNLQTAYVLGGTDYFSTPGVVGTTKVVNTGSVNRLYLTPLSSYRFEPLSIASTIYSIYGVKNPHVLTDGNPVITPLFA
jgi:hypothetical protein